MCAIISIEKDSKYRKVYHFCTDQECFYHKKVLNQQNEIIEIRSSFLFTLDTHLYKYKLSLFVFYFFCLVGSELYSLKKKKNSLLLRCCVLQFLSPQSVVILPISLEKCDQIQNQPYVTFILKVVLLSILIKVLCEHWYFSLTA